MTRSRNPFSRKLLATSEISNGKFTHKYLSVMSATYTYGIETVHVKRIVQHAKDRYPTGKEMLESTDGCTEDYIWHTVGENFTNTLQKAINSWEEKQTKFMICETYLIGYCNALSADLYKDLKLMR